METMISRRAFLLTALGALASVLLPGALGRLWRAQRSPATGPQVLLPLPGRLGPNHDLAG
jgi:hypothetical protein